MSAEAKFYPKTKRGRQAAIEAAFSAQNLFSSNSALTPATQVRLLALRPQYAAKLTQFFAKKALLATAVAEKEKTRKSLKIYASHFIQVLNLAIHRGELAAGARAVYGLPVEHDKIPKMQEEDYLIHWATNLVTGEAQRVGAGGVPMTNPSIGDVQSRLTAMNGFTAQIHTAKLELFKARKELRNLNVEADRLIRKMWREVEVFFGEKPRPSMRRSARRWGVVYGLKGGEKEVRGMVADKETGELLAGVTVKWQQGRNKVQTDKNGQYALNTTLMKKQKLLVQLKGYIPVEISVVLKEEIDIVRDILMEKMPEV